MVESFSVGITSHGKLYYRLDSRLTWFWLVGRHLVNVGDVSRWSRECSIPKIPTVNDISLYAGCLIVDTGFKGNQMTM